MENDETFYTNVAISVPYLFPGLEEVSFQGFAWSSELGIIPEMGDIQRPIFMDFERKRGDDRD